MHDILAAHILKPPHNVLEESQGLLFGQFLLLLEVVPQISLLAKLCDYVHVVAGLVDIEQLHDIFMLHLLHDFDFAVDVAEVVLIGEDALINHLDCHVSLIDSVPAEVDRSVGALAEEMVEGEDVFLDLLLTF